MAHALEKDRLTSVHTVIVFLIVGMVLAFVRWLLLLFPIPNLFEAIFFCIMGYILGAHCCEGKWKWGIYVAAPSMLMIIYSLVIGSANTDATIRDIISLILIPLSTCFGIWLKNRKGINNEQ